MNAIPRPYRNADSETVLRLNAESVAVLNPMDGPRPRALAAVAHLAQVAEAAGEVVGFLLAFGDGREYDSPNCQWFAGRFKRFLYVDRVAVDARCCRGFTPSFFLTPRSGAEDQSQESTARVLAPPRGVRKKPGVKPRQLAGPTLLDL